jgi:hypothetical protein
MLGDRKKNYPPFPFVMKSAGARLKEGTDTLIVFFSMWPILEVPNLREVDRQESRQVKYLPIWSVVGGGYLFEVEAAEVGKQILSKVRKSANS